MGVSFASFVLPKGLDEGRGGGVTGVEALGRQIGGKTWKRRLPALGAKRTFVSSCVLGIRVSVSIKSLGIDRLNIKERLALVEEIWDSIAADSDAVPVTDAQRAELDRRLADYEANPRAGVPWEEVKSSIVERLKK